MALQVHYQNKKFRLKESRKIRNWLAGVIRKEGFEPGKISFIFTDDNFLREINVKYLEHDYFTDVITFDLSENSSDIEGEIYISTDTVRLNASSLGIPFINEVLRVMVHGILHLTGYDDRTEEEREQMRDKEDFYLRYLGAE